MITTHRANTIWIAAAFFALLLTATAWPVVTQAQMPQLSQAQIEQFQRLPRAQQEALARQYGVDISALQSMGRRSESRQPDQGADLERAERERQREVDDERETRRDEDKDELKPFGYHLFRDAPSTFAPVGDMPVPTNYVLGPGDTLKIQLYGKQNQSAELLVDRSGQIQFPEVGPVSVAGLTFDDARQKLHDMVERRFIGVSVSVSLGELRSMQVLVLGDARHPGAYTVSSLSSMVHALFAAGGIAETGSLRRIELRRGGELVSEMDFYDLLLSGNTTSDQRLQPGDVIFIPSVGEQVAVSGQVRRPALYELKGGETLQTVLNMAGGIAADAFAPQAQLTRVEEGAARSRQTVDLRRQRQLALRHGDKIEVGVIGDLADGFISIQGAVNRPGQYGFQSGQRVSDLLGSLRQDYLDVADLGYAVIVRERAPGGSIETLAFSPLAAIASPESDQNPELQSRDRILVFSRQTLMDLEALEEKREEQEKQRVSASLQQRDSRDSGDRSIRQRSAKDEEEELAADLSRYTLLAPVLDQLRRQATPDAPEQIVGINGAVRFPGRYPLAANTTVASLIKAAGGLQAGALDDVGEISRLVPSDEPGRMDTRILPIEGLLTSNYQALSAGDVLHIRGVADYGVRFEVELAGEVQYPGRYTVAKGETLQQLLKRAGGLTDQAYPAGAVFSRESLRERERQRMEDARRRLRQDLIGIAANQASRGGVVDVVARLEDLLVEADNTEITGRMVINLEGQMRDDAEVMIRLEDGDRLVVPPIQQAVTVYGEVQSPTSHLISRHMSLDDYISASGGFTAAADRNRVYVVRVDGSVWLPKRSRWFGSRGQSLEPGDTIVVPMELDRINRMELATNISQLVFQMALSAATVSNL